ncbi:DinB family protein [Chitinophaga solisilvae]|uniref:DinB family protein n=1 Tax=Chitinophaga solisilvae TaxID=1233460 RepID=A0A9Q5GVY8_9BACT|nr:DinB family protein [Chitinophaga solisilvae]NSL87743.1 DinB family protein [Chitinophaga solisilvae]
MKKTFFILLMMASVQGYSQDATPTLKTILLSQLKSTHDAKDWFVPVNTALEGLTPEQANWKDNSGNHSIAQLVQHLIFWNEWQLEKFNGKTDKSFSGDNNETFVVADQHAWNASVKKIDDIMKGWENVVNTTDPKKMGNWYDVVAHISAHNAYHIGQIVYIRKLQGSWNPDKGVK